MKRDTENATEFDRFTSLVDSVLSVPQADVERIKSEPLSKERRLQDLQYLKQDIEADERRKSQIISDKTA
jgi:hypothetical protein